MRVTSHPESILNDSQFKACASEISCMSDFTDGCAEKHFYSELLVVLEGYRMNFILGFLWCVVKNLIKMELTFCCWYFTVYVSFHLDRRKNFCLCF